MTGGTRYNLLSNPFPAYLALNNAADGTNNWLATNIGLLNSDAAQQVVWAWNGTSYDTFTHADGDIYCTWTRVLVQLGPWSHWDSNFCHSNEKTK